MNKQEILKLDKEILEKTLEIYDLIRHRIDSNFRVDPSSLKSTSFKELLATNSV